MNLNFRKTALLLSACTFISGGYFTPLYALPSEKVAIVQQAKKITGKVTDKMGDPIIGANIVEKGTTNGTITDLDGNFTLNVNPESTLSVKE